MATPVQVRTRLPSGRPRCFTYRVQKTELWQQRLREPRDMVCVFLRYSAADGRGMPCPLRVYGIAVGELLVAVAAHGHGPLGHVAG